jgi:hypothetical protein
MRDYWGMMVKLEEQIAKSNANGIPVAENVSCVATWGKNSLRALGFKPEDTEGLWGLGPYLGSSYIWIYIYRRSLGMPPLHYRIHFNKLEIDACST